MIAIFGNHGDPAFRWEGLVRSIYNCGKYGDPNGYAAQDFFDLNFVEEPNRKAKAALPHIIAKLREDFPENEELQDLHEAAENFETQEEAIDIIDSIISMADELGLE